MQKEEKAKKHPMYYKDVKALDYMDVYDVCEIFGIHDSSGCLQHAIKKLLCAGGRGGGKTVKRDLLEAITCIERHLEIRNYPV